MERVLHTYLLNYLENNDFFGFRCGRYPEDYLVDARHCWSMVIKKHSNFSTCLSNCTEFDKVWQPNLLSKFLSYVTLVAAIDKRISWGQIDIGVHH